MSYRHELRAHYDKAERMRETAEQWMDIIENGELSHAMVMKLVRERDDLINKINTIMVTLDCILKMNNK